LAAEQCDLQEKRYRTGGALHLTHLILVSSDFDMQRQRIALPTTGECYETTDIGPAVDSDFKSCAQSEPLSSSRFE